MTQTVVKFNPKHTAADDEASKKRFGYRGPFPSTACRNCENEYFTWIGDWGLGYRCGRCGQTWVRT